MKITRVGLDIAKRVFQMHGVDEHGAVKARKTLKRAQVLQYFRAAASMPDRHGGLRGAHYWPRELGKFGHAVRLMAAQFVNPYRKNSKNDVNDAEAICEWDGRICGLCP